MTRTSLLILLALFIGMPVLSMIKTLPFPELVKTADAIIIVKVEAKEVSQIPGAKYPETQNSLMIEKVLKGELKANELFTLSTAGTTAKPVLDRPLFPEKGERVLLFLKKINSGWVIFNRVQGLWPLETGTEKTLGMGFNYSIKQVEEELAKK